MTDRQTQPVPTGPFATEPAAIVGWIVGAVTAVITLLVAYGVSIDDTQRDAILGVVAVVAPLIAAYIIRRKVASPNTAQAAANTAAMTGTAPDVMKG